MPDGTPQGDEVVRLPGGVTVRHAYHAMLVKMARHGERAGQHRSLAKLARECGFVEEDGRSDELAHDTASEAMLRGLIPPSAYRPAGMLLLSLERGVLNVAVSGAVDQRDRDRLAVAANQAGFKVGEVHVQNWDRKDLEVAFDQHRHVTPEQIEDRILELERDTRNAAVLHDLANDLLADAMEHQASDIHLTHLGGVASGRCWVDYQVNNDIHHKYVADAAVLRALAVHFKKTANCHNYSLSDRIQVGRFSFPFQGRQIDVRLDAAPAQPDGETITMRLLDRATLRGFTALFAAMPEVGRRILGVVQSPVKTGAIILVSGPNAQGKTSTLCAILMRVPRDRRRWLMIENPSEFDLPFITQQQVEPDIEGRDFPDFIKSSLRQAPHGVVVGELRDSASAEAALRVPETGVALLGTIHADHAFQTVERVIGMLPPEFLHASGAFILANNLTSIINQRLAPTVCPNCHTRVPVSRVEGEVRDLLAIPAAVGTVSVARPGGCPICWHTGFGGRTLAAETLLFPTGPRERAALVDIFRRGAIAELYDLPTLAHAPRVVSLRTGVVNGLVDPHVAAAILRAG